MSSINQQESTTQELPERLSCLQAELEQARARLTKVQERYELASQAGRTGAWDADLRTGTLYIDPLLRQSRNIPHGQTPTLTAFLTAVHPADLLVVSQAVSAFLRGTTSDYQIEHRNLLDDGSVRWVAVHAIALRDKDGFPYRLVGTETDITDKRNAELALQIAKSELEQRVEQRTADLEQINNALKKEIGRHEQARDNLRQSEDSLRRLYLITIDRTTSYAEKVERLLALGCDLLQMETGMLSRVTNNDYELLHVRSPSPMKPGMVLPLDMTYCELLLTIPPDQWPLTFVNIGQSEQAYHPAYQNFRLEAYIGLPIIVRGRPYGTLNFSSASVRNEPFTSTQKGMIQLMGQWLTTELERQQLEAEFRQSQKMEAIGQLTSGVAHDLNNLLTIITGYSDLLTEPELGLSGSPLRYARAIRDAGHQVSELTNQLLIFSRAQEQELQILQLNEIIIKTKSMIERLIGENIIVATELAPNLGNIKADPVQINQILVNLAVNARDAMPSGGQLLIATSMVTTDNDATIIDTALLSPGQYVLLTVSDTGVGMAPETQAKAFEPFFTTKEKGKGTGLGLSTVYSIVMQTGGKVYLESEPGSGTTFQIYFPTMASYEVVEKQEEIVEGLPPMAVGHEVVLLVEDRESVREFVQEVLLDAGYTVLVAEDGMQAVSLFNDYAEPIDLLLTDVIMPGMNGAELASFLLDLSAGLKVLYMSGYTDAISLQTAHPGQKHFLHKPFMPHDLLWSVRQALDD
ncbi:MAG: response regulator [Anaerolineales bacterium]|nr:response regulator [Anaerolineales bacterium]